METDLDSNQYLTIRELEKNGILVSIGKDDEKNGIGFFGCSAYSQKWNVIIRGDSNGTITFTDLDNFTLLSI